VQFPKREFAIKIQRDEQMLARPFHGSSVRHGAENNPVQRKSDEKACHRSRTWPGDNAHQTMGEESKAGFCIYIDTFFQGPVPVVGDGENKYVVFETELEAQKEIADNAMIRLKQFLDGERDFYDAITVEEYVVPVMVYPDGTLTDEDGNCFGSHIA
jgi:hypothetical protein